MGDLDSTMCKVCYIVLLFTFIIKNLAKLFVAQVEMIQNCNFIAYKTAPNLVTSAGLLDAGTFLVLVSPQSCLPEANFGTNIVYLEHIWRFVPGRHVFRGDSLY